MKFFLKFLFIFFLILNKNISSEQIEEKILTIKTQQELKNLYENKIKEYLKSIQCLDLKFEQNIKEGNSIQSGTGFLIVQKPNDVVYEFSGITKNENYKIIKNGEDAFLFDKKTEQKTYINRKNGIENIFLKEDKLIDKISFEIHQKNNKLYSCIKEKKSIFCLIFNEDEETKKLTLTGFFSKESNLMEVEVKFNNVKLNQCSLIDDDVFEVKDSKFND